MNFLQTSGLSRTEKTCYAQFSASKILNQYLTFIGTFNF